MAHIRMKKASLISYALIIATLLSGCDALSNARKQFIEDIDSIAMEVRVMYMEAGVHYAYNPILHIAFADIDFDSVPEFFYGYQTITGSHNKIWYRAYSLKQRAIIGSEHPVNWNTYLDDEKCSFSTGPDRFLEGYFLDNKGSPCFVTKAFAGAVTQTRTDYVFIEYKDSTLRVNTGFECNEELLELNQSWVTTNGSDIRGDIIRLLDEYSAQNIE